MWLALTAAALSGAAGLLFTVAVTQSGRSAAPASRAGVLAVFFVIAYLGMGIPSVAFGIVIHHAPLRTTMIAFAAILAVGTVVAVLPTVRPLPGNSRTNLTFDHPGT